MKRNRIRPAALRRKSGFFPVDGLAGGRQPLVYHRLYFRSADIFADFNLSAPDINQAADRIRRKNICFRQNGYRSAGPPRIDFGFVIIIIVKRAENPAILGIILPLADFPLLVVAAGYLPRRNVGMDHQQRIGALCIVKRIQMLFPPGRRQRFDTSAVPIDADFIGADTNQISLLSVKFKRNQAGFPVYTVNISQAPAPRNAAGRMNNYVFQRASAVFKYAQIAATVQIAADTAGGKICFDLQQIAHCLASTRLKSSKRCGVDCWASVNRARFSSS